MVVGEVVVAWVHVVVASSAWMDQGDPPPRPTRGDGWAEAASGKRTFGRGNFGEVSRNFPESASAKCQFLLYL